MREQQPAIGSNVPHDSIARYLKDLPGFPVGSHRKKHHAFPERSSFGGGIPDLAPVRRPCQAFFRLGFRGQPLYLAVRVRQCHIAAIISKQWMFEKCHELSVGRYARVTDIAVGLEQHPVDGIFELLRAPSFANDRKLLSIPAHIGVPDTF